MKKVLLLAGAALVVSCGAKEASTLSGENYKIGTVENVALGRGLSTVTSGAYIDLRAPDCVLHDGLSAVPGAGQLSLSVRSLTSTADFEKSVTEKFGIGVADAAEKAKAFDASFNYKGVRQALSSQTVSVGEIIVRRDFPYQSLTNARPSEKITGLADSKDPYALYKTCGDSFVYGYKKAIEVNAYIICETSSASQKKDIDNSFKGFGIYKGVQISLEAGHKLDSIAKASSNGCGLAVLARGGSGSIKTGDVKEFLQSSVDYATTSSPEHGFLESIETLKYSELGHAGLNAVLKQQTIDFPRATELVKPFAASAQNLISLYLTAPSSNIEKSLVELGASLKRCSLEPWDSSKCVLDSGTPDDVDILDTF